MSGARESKPSPSPWRRGRRSSRPGRFSMREDPRLHFALDHVAMHVDHAGHQQQPIAGHIGAGHRRLADFGDHAVRDAQRSALDEGHLPRDAAGEKVGGLAGADVVEGARDDDVQTIGK